jgi:hypothetical protein
MRVGVNPAKNIDNELKQYSHRIILTVFIPEESGYYVNSFEVLRLCLDSLFATIDLRYSRVTIIDNDSCESVRKYLIGFLNGGKIDRLTLNNDNRGKVEAVLSAILGSSEDFITISDSDIFFKAGWVDATVDIFNGYPKAGVVSPLPLPHLLLYYNVICFNYNFLLGKIRHGKILDEDEYDEFYLDIKFNERKPLDYNFYKDHQFYLMSNGIKSILGAGHAVATYNRKIFAGVTMPKVPVVFANKLEREYLDEVSERQGFWRLATASFYAYHMGNKPGHMLQVEQRTPNKNFADCKKQNGQKTRALLANDFVALIFFKILKLFYNR